MTLVHTGPGTVEIYPHPPPGGKRALLSNFDIDNASLKQEHILFLKSQMDLIISNRKIHVWLNGSTSHTGSDKHNMKLSATRGYAVRDFLIQHGVYLTQITVNFEGEQMSNKKILEYAPDRSVAFLSAPVSVIEKFSHSTYKVSLNSRKFRLKILRCIDAGESIANVTLSLVEIWDVLNNLSCKYTYVGLGIGASLLPVGFTFSGPWNNIYTTAPLSVTDFECEARFTTLGVGPESINFLTMQDLPHDVKTVPSSLRINTGFTVNNGGSSTNGRMVMVKGSLRRFSGF